MWAKGFDPDGDSPACGRCSHGPAEPLSVSAVVSVSDLPEGPFSLADPSQPFYSPGGHTYADATLYVDEPSQSAYVYFRSRQEGMYVGKLSPDCLSVEGEPALIIHDPNHEAPAVFSWGGSVYLWTSLTKGFEATQAELLVNRDGSFSGPFESIGNPTGSNSTFGSQGTYVLPNPAWSAEAANATTPQFILVADRWQPDSEQFGKYVWLPLWVRRNGTVFVKAPKEWTYQAPLESA